MRPKAINLCKRALNYINNASQFHWHNETANAIVSERFASRLTNRSNCQLESFSIWSDICWLANVLVDIVDIQSSSSQQFLIYMNHSNESIFHIYTANDERLFVFLVHERERLMRVTSADAIRLLMNWYGTRILSLFSITRIYFVDDDFDELSSIWWLTLYSLVIFYLFYCLLCLLLPSLGSSFSAINLLHTRDSESSRRQSL